VALPALMDALDAMQGVAKLAGGSLQTVAPSAAQLTVRIFSFGYHQQMPQDESGNGGGFVFDARALPNPGREQEFIYLTGKDEPVAAYLRQQDSVRQYLANVTALVDASVATYQRRGFSNLMISFGCTGGQHRSVYLAEQLAKHLHTAGVTVELRHTNSERWPK
jgi:RNase adaptor protein for sRNA GlmZ degradation